MNQDKTPICLPLHKLSLARKAAKVSKQEAAKAIKCHLDKITRIENGSILNELEDLATEYKCQIIIVNCEKWKKIEQILAIL